MQNKLIQYLALGVLLSISVDEVLAQDRYKYCQQQAESASGYYGDVPDKYLPGGALQGAMKGAAGGAAVGWLSGNDAGHGAGKGALLGAIFGGIARGVAKDKQNKKRREYQFEMKMCMSAG